MVAGPDHRLVYQNPASAAVLGARPLGTPAAEGFNDYPEWVQALDDVLTGGEVIRFHRAPMAVPGNGGGARVILLDIVFSPVLAEGGTPSGVMCQAVDVTLSAAADSRAEVAVALNQISLELARSLDPDQVARAVSRLAAGAFDGWAVLDLYQPDGSLARTHSFHSDPAKQEDLTLLCSLPRVTGRIAARGESLASTAARTGETFTGRFDTAALVAAASSARHARILGSLQPIARRFAADVLGGWGVDPETVEWALLLISELVTNAVRHADGPIRLRMDLTAVHLRVGVFDDSHRSPYLRHADPDETGGRGLQLVEHVATEWGVDTGDTGKWVWFTLPRGASGGIGMRG